MTRTLSIELPDHQALDGGETDHRAIQLDIRSLTGLLLRRVWLIGSILIAVVLIAAYLTLSQTPTYRATSTVIVETNQANVIDLGNVFSGTSLSTAIMDTEVEVIASPSLLRRVVVSEDLAENPEFNPFLDPRPPSLPSRARGWVSARLSSPPAAPAEPVLLTPEQEADRLTAIMVGILRSKVSVSRLGTTYLIEITVTSESPDTAARLANAIAEQYRVDQLEARLDATRTATSWLAERVEVLRDEVTEKEAEVEAYRTQSGLLAAQGTTLTETSIQTLQQQKISLQADLDRVKARYDSMRRQLASGAGVDTIAEVLDSPVITALKNQRSELLRRVAELEATLLPRHPDLVAANSQTADIERQIEAEIQRITASLAAEVAVAEDRISDIDARIRRDRSELIRNNTSLVRLRELEREADASREIYEAFVDRLKETREQNDLVRPDARVLALAGVPGRPSSPRVLVNLFLGLLFGLGLGVGAAILAEIFDGKVTNVDDLERRLGLSVVGSVPLIKSLPLLNAKSKQPGNFLVENPLSGFAESMRYLRAAIAFSDIDGASRVVTLTSSLANEGKTSLSVAIARMSAMSGIRTLVIDGDFRRRQLTEAFDLTPEFGLIEHLFGKGALTKALYKDPETSLTILPLNLSGHAPHDVFGTQAFDRLLDRLRKKFELIIIDTGPLLLMAEARVIAKKSDKTLLVVRWRHSNRKSIRKSLRILKAFGVDVLGAVLNMVDTSNRRYGDDPASRYSAYRRYYARESGFWQRLFGRAKGRPEIPTLPTPRRRPAAPQAKPAAGPRTGATRPVQETLALEPVASANDAGRPDAADAAPSDPQRRTARPVKKAP